LVLGENLVRNGLSLLAWLLNVPREALRLTVSGDVGRGLLWAAAAAIPMAAAWVLATGVLRQLLNRRQVLTTIAFVAVAYAPYFPLAWNTYAYYAAIAAILPCLLLGAGLTGSRSEITGVLLIALSSWIAVQGTRWLDHPGLIGRARWAETTVQELAAQDIGGKLLVLATEPQRFYAIGLAGLAWRLGLEPAAVRLVEECPAGTAGCLIIDSDGHWHWSAPR
jgi:hypothetical protein